MARLNAQQYLDKWGRRLSAAGPDISAGVDRTSKDPGSLAAAAQGRWSASLADPKTQAAWAHNVAAVGPAAWKTAMKNKGIPRLQQGIAAAQTNKVQRITNLLSAVDATSADIAALPKGGLEQNIARSVAWQRGMSARAPKRNGG